MKTHTPPQGKCQVFAGNARGLTLPELTLTISVILGLIGILFVGSAIYASESKRASCVVAQDQVLKALTAEANMKARILVPGVDYYAKAVEDGVLESPQVCPETGDAFIAEVDHIGGQLVIKCTGCGAEH